MTNKIFNPLQALADSGAFQSTSSLHNTEIAVCPKCKKPMIRAVIANDDEVFYCEKDRVVHPFPDKKA
jgi:formamidopyrimidine-DNA glycosylase